MPGAVNDRGLHLGGIFSGLYHAQGEPENVFYAIAVGNDNDFCFDRFDAAGYAVNNHLPSELLILRLSQALPLTP